MAFQATKRWVWLSAMSPITLHITHLNEDVAGTQVVRRDILLDERLIPAQCRAMLRGARYRGGTRYGSRFVIHRKMVVGKRDSSTPYVIGFTSIHKLGLFRAIFGCSMTTFFLATIT